MTTMPPGPWLASDATLDDLIAGRLPDADGRYGAFGGRFVPEMLVPALSQLEEGARDAFADPAFQQRIASELNGWIGRPTPLTRASRLGASWGRRPSVRREAPRRSPRLGS